MVKMAKATYIYGTHWHTVTKRAVLLSKIPPHKNGTQHKWHLIKTVPHKNGISKLTFLVFWSTTNTLLIEPTLTIRHKLEKHDFKTYDHGSESYNKFKNFSLKITDLNPWQITFWHFFTRCVIFVKHHFF